MGHLYYSGIFILQIESQFSKNENNFKYFDFKTLGLIFLESGHSDMVLEDVTELYILFLFGFLRKNYCIKSISKVFLNFLNTCQLNSLYLELKL